MLEKIFKKGYYPSVRVLTGLQPTDRFHVGNYIGAIRKIVSLQDQYHVILLVADMHALTSQKFPFHDLSLDAVATYLACGVDPERVTILKQSDVGQYHTFLSWILSCFCPTGMLDRMVQMKDKSKQYGDLLGIYEYPVLMAADVLLYNINYVPVGEDQRQHMELVRFLCRKMNSMISQEFFVEPMEIKDVEDSKILSLKTAERKMSKSYGGEECLFLDDNDEVIEKKIFQAKTDSMLFPGEYDENRKEINNLVNIYLAFSDDLQKESIFQQFEGKYTVEFKKALITLLQEKIRTFRDKKSRILTDISGLEGMLKTNAQKITPFLEQRLDILRKTFY